MGWKNGRGVSRSRRRSSLRGLQESINRGQQSRLLAPWQALDLLQATQHTTARFLTGEFLGLRMQQLIQTDCMMRKRRLSISLARDHQCFDDPDLPGWSPTQCVSIDEMDHFESDPLAYTGR
jgi:hypothetical protein